MAGKKKAATDESAKIAEWQKLADGPSPADKRALLSDFEKVVPPTPAQQREEEAYYDAVRQLEQRGLR